MFDTHRIRWSTGRWSRRRRTTASRSFVSQLCHAETMMLRARAAVAAAARRPLRLSSCRALSDVPRREPLLFTPGPLTTSLPVKQARRAELL